VQKYFARHSLRRRVIALAAAYAIALSSLIANFAGAQAASDIVGQPGTVICHHDLDGQTDPSPGQTDSKLCAQCCIGCMMLSAALPPPPATGVALIRSASAAVHIIIAPDVVTGAAVTKSNRSRAPPLPL
jgi:hypothetical protein